MERMAFRHRSLVWTLLWLSAISGCTNDAMQPEEFDSPQLVDAVATPSVDRRPEIRAMVGPPDSFTIWVDEIEGTTVRFESWSYHDLLTRFDFVDGELLWTVELESLPDGALYPLFYAPEEFEPLMTLEAARTLLQNASPDMDVVELDLAGGEDPDPALVGGTALVGDQIVLGFADGLLVYVESFALAEDNGALAVLLEEEG
jgi:hypothetical protein